VGVRCTLPQRVGNDEGRMGCGQCKLEGRSRFHVQTSPKGAVELKWICLWKRDQKETHRVTARSLRILLLVAIPTHGRLGGYGYFCRTDRGPPSLITYQLQSLGNEQVRLMSHGTLWGKIRSRCKKICAPWWLWKIDTSGEKKDWDSSAWCESTRLLDLVNPTLLE
jgi:hypothetical protein